MSDLQSPLVEISTSLHQSGVDGGAKLSVQELPFRSHFNIRGDVSDARFREAVEKVTSLTLPTRPNTVSRAQDSLAAWLGPDEWLLTGLVQSNLEKSLTEALEGQHAAVVDVSGGQTIVRLSGPAWRDVVSSACPLDLHSRAFAEGQCAQTIFAHANVVLVHVSTSDQDDAVDIIIRRSFSDHVMRWVMDAAGECGFEIRTPLV
ncbi:MAG: sarcosine oxidase subunit gamma [Arenicellales bacterium]